jgi:hypothetical protein
MGYGEGSATLSPVRQPETGRGPVDFTFSNGVRARVHLSSRTSTALISCTVSKCSCLSSLQGKMLTPQFMSALDSMIRGKTSSKRFFGISVKSKAKDQVSSFEQNSSTHERSRLLRTSSVAPPCLDVVKLTRCRLVLTDSVSIGDYRPMHSSRLKRLFVQL